MPAKVELIPSLPGLSPVGGKPVVARFDGGQLSSDGGLLVLREVEQRLDVAGRLAACITDPRDPERVVHGLDEIIWGSRLKPSKFLKRGEFKDLRSLSLMLLAAIVIHLASILIDFPEKDG